VSTNDEGDRSCGEFERLRRVISIGTGASFDADAPAEVLCDLLAEAVAAAGATTGLLAELTSEHCLETLAFHGPGAAPPPLVLTSPATTGRPAADAVRGGEPIWLGPATATAALPLILGRTTSSRTVGVLELGFAAPRLFTARERALLLAIADACAVAVERRAQHLAAEARQRARQRIRLPIGPETHLSAPQPPAIDGCWSQALSVLGERLAHASATVQICSIVANLIPAVMNADSANIGFLNEDATELILQHDCRLPVEVAARYSRQSLTDDLPYTMAVRESRAIYLGDPQEIADRFPAFAVDLKAAGLRAVAALPVRGDGNRPLGVVGVAWNRPVRFDASTRAAMESIADLCGAPLERTRLYDAEHVLVEGLQRRMLRPFPTMPGVDSHAICRPADPTVGIGGDFYAGLRLDAHRLGLIVGDVTGHGVVAAADMAELRAVLCTLLTEGIPLAEVVSRAETALRLSDSSLTFATIVLAVLDTGTDTLSYLHAGHPPLLLRRAGGQVVSLDDARQALLGWPSAATAPASVPFPAGSVLVAYTDGLVERRGRQLHLGIDRLADALGKATGDARQIAGTLLDECDLGYTALDDRAIVVIGRVNECSPGGHARR
jgi:GAF domain-containing protein